MFHSISVPAATHLFLYVALSPWIITWSYFAAKFISNSLAETIISPFENLFAVSLITENASGKIASSVSSIILVISFSLESISENIFSFSSEVILLDSALFFKSLILSLEELMSMI